MTTKPEVGIFIASSRHAAPSAQKLYDALVQYKGDKYTLKPKTWWSTSSTLAAIIDDLFDQTQQNDFAIILLTSELTEEVPKGDEDKEKRKIRYNAIYEAGLFSGALGPSKDRCFLVASGTKEQLPTDLLGLKWYFFDEKSPDNRLEQIGKEIGRIINNFSEDNIRPLRGLKLPLLMKSDLLRRESHKDEPGGRLERTGALVFVNTPNPVEMEDAEFAETVLHNMLEYRIKYQYVFEAVPSNIVSLSKVIANLTQAKLPESWKKTQNEAWTMIAKHLNIFFVKENPGLEYCVHNADTDEAVCYLRTSHSGPGPRWIQWEKGPKARLVATEIDRIRDRDGCQSLSHVFQNTHYVRVYDIDETHDPKECSLNEQGRKIWDEVEFWLPKTMEQGDRAAIKKVCFGNAK